MMNNTTQFMVTPDFLKQLDDKSIEQLADLVRIEQSRRAIEKADKLYDRFDPRHPW